MHRHAHLRNRTSSWPFHGDNSDAGFSEHAKIRYSENGHCRKQNTTDFSSDPAALIFHRILPPSLFCIMLWPDLGMIAHTFSRV